MWPDRADNAKVTGSIPLGATIVETRSWVLSDDRMYEHCLGMIDVYCNAYNMGNHIGMVNDNVKL